MTQRLVEPPATGLGRMYGRTTFPQTLTTLCRVPKKYAIWACPEGVAVGSAASGKTLFISFKELIALAVAEGLDVMDPEPTGRPVSEAVGVPAEPKEYERAAEESVGPAAPTVGPSPPKIAGTTASGDGPRDGA